ncbi:MAG: sugar phosphate isomerase/epimerase family protein [Armatimonadota bacterium]
MSDLPLGTSTWCFNGLLTAEAKAAIDWGRPHLSEYTDAAIAYFKELVDAILDSKVRMMEIWYSDTLLEPGVFEQLQRLSAAGKINSVHTPFAPNINLSSEDDNIRQNGVNACCAAAQLLSDLNGKVLVVHSSAMSEVPSDLPENIDRSVESITKIADRCSELGLQAAIEILTRPNLGDTSVELLDILRKIDRPNVGFCIDVNHVFPPDALIPTVKALGRHILTLHISDYDGIAERHWLPIQGIIDWSGLVKALREVDYQGPFMYEARFETSGFLDALDKIETNYKTVMESAI